MDFCLRDGGDDGEYNGVDFVEISKIRAMQDTNCVGKEPFDRVKPVYRCSSMYSKYRNQRTLNI